VVKYATNPRRQIQRLREMWLKEGRHFAVKTPEDNHDGYVNILREGPAYAAWLSVYGSKEQRRLAAEFVKYILRRAEEAGIPDAEHRVKQFVLELIDILARARERYRRDALKAVSTVEKALRATAFAGLSAAALYSVYSGLCSEAVVSSAALAIALAEVGQFRKAVQYLQKAAKALYEAARDVFEQVKVTVRGAVHRSRHEGAGLDRRAQSISLPHDRRGGWGGCAGLDRAGKVYHVTASGDDAVKLASLYFLYGLSLLEGMKK
jgi:tetratricopeptide (TPR) repeat protein